MNQLVVTIIAFIALLSFAVVSGYLSSRYRTTSKRLREVRKDKEKHLDPLMSSAELTVAARKLIKLREKAERMRRS